MRDIEAFVEDYRATWQAVIAGQSPVAALTRFFHDPCMMIAVDGELATCEGAEAVPAFNRSRLEAFRAGGAATAHVLGSDARDLGDHLALAEVNWELRRADGAVERAWRHIYTLRRTDDGLRILISTFQSGS